MLLKNKTAVITGCSKGIGKKILEIFSSNGANIFACTRNINDEFKNHLEDLKKKFNNEIIPIEFDLGDENQVKESANNILLQKRPIDILVNNAATIHTAIFQMTSIKKVREIFEIDFFSNIKTLYEQ